jgi:predicted nuclease of predicted toxin-antitoxin system
MRILLDECIPRKLKNHLRGHDCITVPDAGLAGKTNGEILSLAEQAGFEVFLTLDQGIEYEQNLGHREIAIVVIYAKSSRLNDLIVHMRATLHALESIAGGQLINIGQIRRA